MLTAIYYMLRDGVEYPDLGNDHFDRRDENKAIRRLVGCHVEVRVAA
jgi:transposase